MLRCGILHEGAPLEWWQSRCLQSLETVAGVQAELCVVPLAASAEGASSWRGSALPILAASVAPDGSGTLDLPPTAAARVLDLELDFMLSITLRPAGPAFANLARLGLWRIELGDWLNYRGGPGGYWEVYDHRHTSTALLVRAHADPDAVTVLREIHLRTQLLSPAKNRQRLLERALECPAQVCRELLRSTANELRAESARGVAASGAAAGGAGGGPVLRSRAPSRSGPGVAQRMVLAARLATRVAATAWRSLFRHDQWNIGIIDQPIGACLAPANRTVRWLPATPRSEFRADPFGVIVAGKATLLCEYYAYGDDRGFIVAYDASASASASADDGARGRDRDRGRGRAAGDSGGGAGAGAGANGVDAALRVTIGPQPPVHLSYPYLFEHEGRLLCVPESSAAEEIALYAVERFPDRWTRIATLVSGRGYADASLFEHEGRWWLAASDVADKGANSELHLWFAPRPEGPWEAHPGNPVKIDVRSARPGGTPFRVDGVLYRPAQDCSSTYGARVLVNRVVELTPTGFREEVAASVDPDPRGPYPAGLHTLSAMGERTVIDGKRTVFAPAQMLRVLRHYLP